MNRIIALALALVLAGCATVDTRRQAQCANGFTTMCEDTSSGPSGFDAILYGVAAGGSAWASQPATKMAPWTPPRVVTCRQSTWPDLAGHYTVTCEDRP